MTIIIKITIEDKIYPNQLRLIKNPPKQLYLKGDINLLNKNIISIVGSRNCSNQGEKLARKFASELSMQGIVIASGMAKGIDTVAHVETIMKKGETIAVLGCGFNNIFPKENENLYKQIINNGGLIVSEYPPDTEPSSKLFIERNRIVSGISIGILVVEAAYRSGTSITAKLAKQQNRKVFVLPHEIEDKLGVGTNRLIRNGAILVTSTKEIIEEFNFLTYKKIENNNINRIKKEPDDKEYKKVYNLIKGGVKDINELCENSNKTIQDMNNILFMLELEGFIIRRAGGYSCV